MIVSTLDQEVFFSCTDIFFRASLLFDYTIPFCTSVLICCKDFPALSRAWMRTDLTFVRRFWMCPLMFPSSKLTSPLSCLTAPDTPSTLEIVWCRLHLCNLWWNAKLSQQVFLTLPWKRAHQYDSNDTPHPMREFQVEFPLLWIKA